MPAFRRLVAFDRWWVWAFGLSIPTAVFVLTAVALPRTHVGAAWQPLAPGRQIVAVVIAAEFCAGARQPAVRAGIVRVLDSLRMAAAEREWAFSAIGYSVDADVESGVTYLRKLYDFDEIGAGGNWLNSGVLRYVWQQHPGPASVPQVLVVLRDIVIRGDSTAGAGTNADSQPPSLEVRDELVLARLTGTDLVEFTVGSLALPPK